MATKQLIKQPLLKKKKKKWISIYSDKEFKNLEIGESLVEGLNNLIGKTVKINLMYLVNDIKKQNTNITFLVNRLHEGRAYAEPIKYELLGSHIKRIVKRAKSKIEDSFVAKTKDNQEIRIKPLILTKDKTTGMIRSRLRRKLIELIKNKCLEVDYNDLMLIIIKRELQNYVKDNLKKIYPISYSEIKVLMKIKTK